MKIRYMDYPRTDEKHKRFFSQLKVGYLIEYSMAYLLQDVMKIARKYGVQLKYCKPGSRYYRMYGDMICQVVSIGKGEPNTYKFDPDELVT